MNHRLAIAAIAFLAINACSSDLSRKQASELLEDAAEHHEIRVSLTSAGLHSLAKEGGLQLTRHQQWGTIGSDTFTPTNDALFTSDATVPLDHDCDQGNRCRIEIRVPIVDYVITGITTAEPHESTRQVLYNCTADLSPWHAVIHECGLVCSGVARFNLFDDGWRLTARDTTLLETNGTPCTEWSEDSIRERTAMEERLTAARHHRDDLESRYRKAIERAKTSTSTVGTCDYVVSRRRTGFKVTDFAQTDGVATITDTSIVLVDKTIFFYDLWSNSGNSPEPAELVMRHYKNVTWGWETETIIVPGWGRYWDDPWDTPLKFDSEGKQQRCADYLRSALKDWTSEFPAQITSAKSALDQYRI